MKFEQDLPCFDCLTNANADKAMKQSKDPFEVAFEEQEDSPPGSPITLDAVETKMPAAEVSANVQEDDDEVDTNIDSTKPSTSKAASKSVGAGIRTTKTKEEEEEEEEENMDVELGKYQPTGDPDKMAKMQ